MTVKFGLHSLVFGDTWTATTARATCAAAAEIGYDLIEVLMFDPHSMDVSATRAGLAGTGLGLRLGMALGTGDDISSPDTQVASKGEASVARALEIASELGAPAVSGITYAAFASYSAPPTPDQRARVAERLARLDHRAGELGVRLGLEPVNRYESFMVNTLDQAAEMIRASEGRHMFIHMDTFHMNIEEGDIGAAIHRNAGLLGYAHVADSNRGYLGGGHFDLKGYFSALASAGYDGDVTVESFSSAVLSPGLVGGVRLWREGWQDARQAARLALETMRACQQGARLAVTTW